MLNHYFNQFQSFNIFQFINFAYDQNLNLNKNTLIYYKKPILQQIFKLKFNLIYKIKSVMISRINIYNIN